MPHLSPEMESCIEACTACHHVCLETVAHCLKRGGNHAEEGHIRLLLDCAHICQTSADFMLRGSSFHDAVCGVCAKVCSTCAADCERFSDDAEMIRCAEQCRLCAESIMVA
jgi:hypothetical protein